MTDRQILRLIGANVKRIRLDANLTQECLAELAEVHWQTISNIENGRFPVLVTSFARISQALDVDANRLLEGLPNPDFARFERVKKALTRKRSRKAA